jgi:NADH dehydrogenase [ubiquinone] 1 alpha subcomplex assembly factor 2
MLVQWNSWLRRTRKDPPTLNELEIDFFRQQSVQQNVERLAIEYKEEKLRLVEPNVAELLAEGEERRKAREREIVDRIRGEEEKEIKSYKLGQIKIGQHEDEGLDQVEVKTTDRQRTQAKLRRELGKFPS